MSRFVIVFSVCVALLALAACAQAPQGSAAQPTVAPPTVAQAAAPASATGSMDAAMATGAPQAADAAPSCSQPAALTPALTEGPYFKAGSPERASLLEPAMQGTPLVITGYVLTADCRPVAHALLDFWQADSQGQYDNSGYVLRGHQYTDANGRYQLTTVVPGLYPGRTEHIHVKVQAPNGPVLTTQLFFPGTAQNQSDGIFDPRLLLNMQNTGSPLLATYDLIVST